MLPVIAAALGIAGYLINGSGAHVSPWFTPQAVTLAALTLIALHLALGSWPRKP